MKMATAAANNVSWRIIGFLICVGIYFIVLDAFDRWPPVSFVTIFLKLFPIFQLWTMVAESFSLQKAPDQSYSTWILAGLTLSGVGDTLLVMRDTCFLYGAAAFAVAQCMYIKAFGTIPIGSNVLTAMYLVLGGMCYAIVFGWYSSGMPTAIRAIVVVYTALISTMAWRAAARCRRNPNSRTATAAVGALVFMVSDLMIIVDKFGPSFYLAQFYIILTYYSAQCLIALSAVL